MSTASKPLSLYHSLNEFCFYMRNEIPRDVLLKIRECYISQFPTYDECKTEIVNDLFPTKIYRQLKWMKDNGFGDYKVGGSAALKLASADTAWENNDVDILVYTKTRSYNYAKQLGLNFDNLIKSWIQDPDDEEMFDTNITHVLTYRYGDFDRKIQLVFFQTFEDSSFINFLDRILDYPAHVLYEVDFDKTDRKTYNFFLPVKTWEAILQKRIPRNLMQSQARIQKYIKRGFEFFTDKE